MKKLLKKLFLSISGFGIIISTSTMVIACETPNDIFRPDPVLPIVSTGFDNVDISRIDVLRFNFAPDLITEITNLLVEAGHNLENIQIETTWNGSAISLTDDLFRNGTYVFNVVNLLNPNDTIRATITITNSRHLQDVFRITQLGEVLDYRPRSILSALMQRDLSTISIITEIANYLTDVNNFEYLFDDEQNVIGAVIRINDVIPVERPTNLYGSLTINFRAAADSVHSSSGHRISEMVGQNLVTNLGVIDRTDTYSLLMHFITANVELLGFLEPLINDLDLDNIFPEINGTNGSIRFYTKPFRGMIRPATPAEQNGEYNNYAHFFNDEGVNLTFTTRN